MDATLAVRSDFGGVAAMSSAWRRGSILADVVATHVPVLFDIEAVVVFVDVVESMRMLQDDELGSVYLLRNLMTALVNEAVLPHQGKVVERQGDGLLLTFGCAKEAIRCAMAMHEVVSGQRFSLANRRATQLRVGIHAGHLLTDSTHLFGQCVNLAARLQQTAEAGDTVVTSAVKDAVDDSIEFHFDDLGEHLLKHWNTPMRLWRVMSASAQCSADVLPVEKLSAALPNLRGTASPKPGLADDFCGVLGAGLAKQSLLQMKPPHPVSRIKGEASLASIVLVRNTY